MNRFNRQLHADEKQVIKNLANGDADKEHRLEAAGCALVHCAAEFAPGTADYAKYSALEAEGPGYTTERAQLQNYNGTSVSLAGYGGWCGRARGDCSNILWPIQLLTTRQCRPQWRHSAPGQLII